MTASHFETLQTRSDGFLHDVRLTRLKHGLRIEARYQQDRFSPDLYPALGVARPETLVSAIDKRQAEFLAGRALAMSAQQASGHIPAQVAIGDDRAPVWPAGLAGSISHARGHCACYLVPSAHGHPGIDIETIASGQGLDAILRLTVNPSETALLSAAADPAVAATLCFSAKETLFKALYPVVRRHFGFHCAELCALPASDHVILELTETLHPSLSAGLRFDIAYESAGDHVVTWLCHQPAGPAFLND